MKIYIHTNIRTLASRMNFVRLTLLTLASLTFAGCAEIPYMAAEAISSTPIRSRGNDRYDVENTARKLLANFLDQKQRRDAERAPAYWEDQREKPAKSPKGTSYAKAPKTEKRKAPVDQPFPEREVERTSPNNQVISY